MTARTADFPTTPIARVRWTLTDSWTITERAIAHWARQPGLLIMGLTFPLLLLAMFAYLFGGAMTVPGGGDYREFLVPGLLAVTMFFGLEATMTAVNADAARGVTERFRSMPIGSPAVVAGRCIADMLFSIVVLAVLVGAGLLIGWEWNEGLGNALYAFALLLLLRFAFIWVGVYLGLVVKGQESIAMVQTLVWPLAALSSVFTSTEDMPDWLGTIADLNPLSATLNATRELFGNPGWGGDSWVAQHGELMAVLWPLVIVAVFFPLSVRAYRALGQ
jgi:ABC-2 type transport system permease protein